MASDASSTTAPDSAAKELTRAPLSAGGSSITTRSALQAKLAEYSGTKVTPPTTQTTSTAPKTGQPQSKPPALISIHTPTLLPPVGKTLNATVADSTAFSSSEPPTASTKSDHSYAAQPATNGPSAGGVKHENPLISSDNSSSGSSSGSSSSSDVESEEEERKETKPTKVPPVQGLSTPKKRGRGRPRKIKPGSAPTTPSKGGSDSDSSKRVSKPPQRLSMTEEKKRMRVRGRGCGNCPGCLRDDCGKCQYCKDKPKFGGPGRKKQRCSLRICSNFVAAPGIKNPRHALTGTPSSSRTESVIAEKKSTKLTAVQVCASDPTPMVQATPVLATITGSPTTTVCVPDPMPMEVVSSAISTRPSAPPISVSTKTAPSTTAPKIATTATTPAGKTTTKKGEATEKDEKMRCIYCGRERKKGIVRSDKFCTQRCLLQWLDDHPNKTLDDAIAAAVPASTSQPASGTPREEKKKQVTRELRNLYIDMARKSPTLTRMPGTVIPHPSTSPPISPPTTTTNPLSPPTLAPAPKPVAATTTIATRQASAAKKDVPVTAGVKRTVPPTTTQPLPAIKKIKPDPIYTTAASTTTSIATKSVTFDLSATTIPVSTVQPISAPPLSRTVQPPSISIVPLDQLTALGTALFNQHKKKHLVHASLIPPGLPSDVRMWTVDQTVKFFESTSDCKDYANLFLDQEIDGTALLLLSHESLCKCLGIKLGRAVKIMAHVEDLRKNYESNT